MFLKRKLFVEFIFFVWFFVCSFLTKFREMQKKINWILIVFCLLQVGTSTTIQQGSWLTSTTPKDSITFSSIFGVIIGDSQAEGHPNSHSRLHPGGMNIFNSTTQDVYGQISFTLRQKTNMRWFNHGIGGQTTDQILARFKRDALGQVYDPVDDRGSKTLNGVPTIVVVIAGINDFYVNHTRTWRTTALNLWSMAKQLRDSRIDGVFLNCPGDTIINDLQSKKIDSLNNWMKSGSLQSFGMAVVDYNTWWRSPRFNDNSHRNGLITDDIHPSQVGYDSLANYIFRSANLPILKEQIIRIQDSDWR